MELESRGLGQRGQQGELGSDSSGFAGLGRCGRRGETAGFTPFEGGDGSSNKAAEAGVGVLGVGWNRMHVTSRWAVLGGGLGLLAAMTVAALSLPRLVVTAAAAAVRVWVFGERRAGGGARDMGRGEDGELGGDAQTKRCVRPRRERI